jgi:hypothetical protein
LRTCWFCGAQPGSMRLRPGEYGEVPHAHPVAATQLADAGIVMGSQVVHDQHVGAVQLRQQVATQPRHEPVCIGRRKHRLQDDPPSHA